MLQLSKLIGAMAEYLTTKELAALLRIKERKVYDLVATGEVPHSKPMGKLLFPRKAIDAWLAQRVAGINDRVAQALPSVFLGSHDPLLDWALRESRCGLATFFDGSIDGLNRFAQRQGMATGLHIFDATTNDWNVHAVRKTCSELPVVLVAWAERRRGLIIHPKLESTIRRLADIKGLKVAVRQPESGAQHLFEHQLQNVGLDLSDIDTDAPLRTEIDAAVSVLEGAVDVTFGLEALAKQYGLPFVPVIQERFDLLVDRRSWFEPAMQTFLGFCRTKAFVCRAARFAGYDVSGLGSVRFNAA